MFFSKPKTFEHFFANVPEEQTAQLVRFREEAAYQTLPLQKGTWQYRKMGQADQAMVLLPGGFTLADLWMKTAQAFSDQYTLLMPDAYARQGIYDLEQVCEGIVNMLDAEKVKKAVFVGVAAGGELAQYFWHKYPQRVGDLIISHCDILGDSEAIRDLRTQNTLNFYRRTPEKMIHNLMIRQLEKDLPADSDWRAYTLAYYRDSIQGLKKKMVLEYVKQSHEMKKKFEYMASRLRIWQGHLLYLSSEDDSITLKSITPLKRLYPAARVHRFAEGQNHVHLLYPEKVNAVMRDFLQAVQTEEKA